MSPGRSHFAVAVGGLARVYPTAADCFDHAATAMSCEASPSIAPLYRVTQQRKVAASEKIRRERDKAFRACKPLATSSERARSKLANKLYERFGNDECSRAEAK